MLVLTNGIARNGALSYKHVRDDDFSLVAAMRFMTFLHRSLLVRSRDSVYHCNPFRLPLAPYLSISTSRDAEKPRRFTMAKVVMTVLSRWEFLARAGRRGFYLGCCGRAISFCGSLGCGWWGGSIRLRTVAFQLLGDLKRMSCRLSTILSREEGDTGSIRHGIKICWLPSFVSRNRAHKDKRRTKKHNVAKLRHKRVTKVPTMRYINGLKCEFNFAINARHEN